MKKTLPFFLLAIAVTALLTPLYPVYAQTASDLMAPEPTASVKRVTRPAPASGSATAAEKLQAAREKAANPALARLDTVQEKLATRAAELKTKLARFRDKAKATRVETVNSNLAAVNLRRTSQMSQSLSRIQAVLAKLKTWAAEQETAGKDVSLIKQAITETETLWTEADVMVKDQADNDYTIAVNTESTVKTDAKTARDSLHNDLKMVHDKVVDVRQTLATALKNWKGAK